MTDLATFIWGYVTEKRFSWLWFVGYLVFARLLDVLCEEVRFSLRMRASRGEFETTRRASHP